jgi:hypothetical protein
MWCQHDMFPEKFHSSLFFYFALSKNNKLSCFQYKLIHRILALNPYLSKCKIKETELFSFRNEAKETYKHFFWDCNVTKNILQKALFWEIYSLKEIVYLFSSITNEKDPEKIIPHSVSSISNSFDHLLIIFTGTTVFLSINCLYKCLQGFGSICN